VAGKWRAVTPRATAALVTRGSLGNGDRLPVKDSLSSQRFEPAGEIHGESLNEGAIAHGQYGTRHLI